MLTNIMPKTAEYFHCELCDFNCSKKSNYNAHLLTRKHKMLTNADNKMPKNAEFVCDDCGKLYKHRQSLHVHKRKCSVKKDTIAVIDKDPTSGDSTIEYLLKENSEMKQMIMEMMGKMGNTTNNTTNNNQFNINMFLNDQCKNAVNFSDFIDRIEISHDDLENNAQLGFVNGMTKILMDNLRMLTLHERPIHCTDASRKTLYVKDNDIWEKDNELLHMLKGISELSFKQRVNIHKWQDENEGWDVKDDLQTKITMLVFHTMTDLDNDVKETRKIISAISKNTYLTNEIKSQYLS